LTHRNVRLRRLPHLAQVVVENAEPRNDEAVALAFPPDHLWQWLWIVSAIGQRGIKKYLASGMIRGIRPVYAKKLLRAFGDKVFDVIEAEPDRLREVQGIGSVRASRIVAAWAEQKVVREIMVFLHSHGVGTARAVRRTTRPAPLTAGGKLRSIGHGRDQA
jgi:hypothetical protein